MTKSFLALVSPHHHDHLVHLSQIAQYNKQHDLKLLENCVSHYWTWTHCYICDV